MNAYDFDDCTIHNSLTFLQVATNRNRQDPPKFDYSGQNFNKSG